MSFTRPTPVAGRPPTSTQSSRRIGLVIDISMPDIAFWITAWEAKATARPTIPREDKQGGDAHLEDLVEADVQPDREDRVLRDPSDRFGDRFRHPVVKVPPDESAGGPRQDDGEYEDEDDY